MAFTVLPLLGTTDRRAGLVPRASGENGRTVVWLCGEYDIATVAAVAEGLAAAIAVDDGDLVVDLTGVQFIDAATIGLFVRARNYLGPRSRQLTVRNPPRRVRRVLDVCGLSGLIDSAPADAGRATVPCALAPSPRLAVFDVPAV